MAINLPPFPANSPPGSWAWTDWWKKLQNYINEITKVAQQGTDNPDPTQIFGLSGLTDTVSINWVTIANYCEFYITIDIDSVLPLVAESAYIDAGGSLTTPGIPPSVGDGLLVCSVFNSAGTVAIPPNPAIPYVQSLGVGYVTRFGGRMTIFLPDFTVAASPSKTLTITGRYNVQ